jgi:hypothetical protein
MIGGQTLAVIGSGAQQKRVSFALFCAFGHPVHLPVVNAGRETWRREGSGTQA